MVLVGIIDYENNVRMCKSISETQVEDFVNEFAGENVRRKQQEFQNIAPSFTHAKRSTHASTIFLKERTGALHAKRSIKHMARNYF